MVSASANGRNKEVRACVCAYGEVLADYDHPVIMQLCSAAESTGKWSEVPVVAVDVSIVGWT